MTKGLLRLRCIEEDKAQYIRWIDKYCAMNTTEIQEEKMRIITKRFCDLDWEVETKWDKLKKFIKRCKPSYRREKEWMEAFDWFLKQDEEFLGKVHMMMGLPKNGIRPDAC